jgi:hypothetical protein
MIKRKMNRRHMIADHHARGTERATPLIRAVDGVLGTRRNLTVWAITASSPPGRRLRPGPEQGLIAPIVDGEGDRRIASMWVSV